jgi:L-lactate dehydrogenase complex protein LldF
MRAGLGLWRFVAERPWLYRLGTAVAVRAMRRFRRRGGGWIRSMPLAGGWTAHRDFPAPAGRTFMEQLRDRERGR